MCTRWKKSANLNLGAKKYASEEGQMQYVIIQCIDTKVFINMQGCIPGWCSEAHHSTVWDPYLLKHGTTTHDDYAHNILNYLHTCCRYSDNCYSEGMYQKQYQIYESLWVHEWIYIHHSSEHVSNIASFSRFMKIGGAKWCHSSRTFCPKSPKTGTLEAEHSNEESKNRKLLVACTWLFIVNHPMLSDGNN